MSLPVAPAKAGAAALLRARPIHPTAPASAGATSYRSDATAAASIALGAPASI